jgi:hypothetical protein
VKVIALCLCIHQPYNRPIIGIGPAILELRQVDSRTWRIGQQSHGMGERPHGAFTVSGNLNKLAACWTAVSVAFGAIGNFLVVFA